MYQLGPGLMVFRLDVPRNFRLAALCTNRTSGEKKQPCWGKNPKRLGPYDRCYVGVTWGPYIYMAL